MLLHCLALVGTHSLQISENENSFLEMLQSQHPSNVILLILFSSRTAYVALFKKLRITKEKIILITRGSGGVGTLHSPEISSYTHKNTLSHNQSL
jgi:NADPH-dependent curcumin reductase CurA